jgi:hypothetical protein
VKHLDEFWAALSVAQRKKVGANATATSQILLLNMVILSLGGISIGFHG